ncbi:hypothetical protein ACFFS4_36375 [Kutzneria kofuensis]|uniref:Uncharacterized protein n=1 Tax=Kutzneria kofuensis TaxID=103725 RepID=A0A7W9KQH5_9PSEU|nr:hypothetical protein [Kutzneria kofuensis]MBB5896755.1 hypothetical protein [Kutzneria kofuensis]
MTGVFRAARRPTYDDLARQQVETAKAGKTADLTALLRGTDAWPISL